MSDYTGNDLMLYGNRGYLNPALVKAQHLTRKQIYWIKELHLEKDILLTRTRARIDRTRPSDMLELRIQTEAAMRELEFMMQDAWGFERDCSKHTHRFNLPYQLLDYPLEVL